jgi:Uncharacterized conserved protein
MISYHNLPVDQRYFERLLIGEKTLVVRIGHPKAVLKHFQEGDTVIVNKQKFEILRITTYENIDMMLQAEKTSKLLHGVRSLRRAYANYPNKQAHIIKIKPQTRSEDCEFLRASTFMGRNHQMFFRIISESYNITDSLCKDYPNRFAWFCSKVLPDIHTGKREIIACYVDGKIAGTAILKKDGKERKICTFYLKEEFRERRVADQFAWECFGWLGTRKPLMTIPEHRRSWLNFMIELHGWKLYETLENYYNDHSSELVYNGTLATPKD